MSLEEILETARQRGIKNITLTGGEPLLQSHIFALLEAFSKEKMFEVEIETNGSIPLKNFNPLKIRLRLLWIISFHKVIWKNICVWKISLRLVPKIP